MKELDCSVIQDLLPNYIDKISSKSTNELLEKHLLDCKECNKALNEMKKVNNKEIFKNQNEEIDYLKGYKKKKTREIIITALFTIFLIIDIVLATSIILTEVKLYLNVYDVDICFRAEEEENNKKTLTYEMTSNISFIDPFCIEYETVNDNEKNIIYCKLVGKFTDYRKSKGFCVPKIDNKTEAVYLVDKKGHGRKIWDKEQGILTRSHIGTDLFIGM